MNIRQAMKEDLDACVRVFALEELRFNNGEHRDKAFLESFLKDDYFLVAEDEGAIYGEPVHAGGVILWVIAVTEGARGKGVGQALMNAFEERCRAQGREWIFLLALDTERHVGFYGKSGFKQGKKLIEFTKDF